MERHPLDADLVEESFEEIRREKVRLEVMLAGKHGLPLFGFARELNSRLRSGDLAEDMEMLQWQSLNAALLDWLEAPEIEIEPTQLMPVSTSEGPPEAAFFIWPDAFPSLRLKN